MKSFLLGLWQRLRGKPDPVRAALAVAVGLFIGVQPVYGLHFVLVMAVCLPLKLDAVLSYLVANVSNPLVAPFLVFAEVEAGSYLTSGRWAAFDLAQARATGALGFARQLVVGSLALGGVLAALGFALAYAIASRRQPSASARSSVETDFERACDRTRARYSGASRGDRYYVAGKLGFDPVFELVSELPGPFGSVLDLGCGRGQLSLLLLELGSASQARGFDSDVRKIDVARQAAAHGSALPAEFSAADLGRAELPAADTILLIDVLHYLPREEQDMLLAAACRALRPGGRLLVRELDAEPGARSRVTRLFEWCARRIGLNRGRATHYRPAREITGLLEQAGLRCEIQGASERTPFANVLIVAGGSPSVKVERFTSPSSTRMSAAKA